MTRLRMEGGARAGRALRLLLLLVLLLAALEYMFGSMLDASPLRTYLYQPQLAANDTARDKIPYHWPKRTQTRLQSTEADNSATPDLGREGSPPLEDAHTSVAANGSSVQSVHSYSNNSTNQVPNLLITKIKEFTTKLPRDDVARSKDNFNTSDISNYTTMRALSHCPQWPPELNGPITANKTEVSLESVENLYPEVAIGGHYMPPACKANHKVAIIVPFRDREQHLAIFLRHMHPFLMKQQLDYGIFIVEQEGNNQFNRAKLMNVGFKEAQKSRVGGWDCFIFHDIDLLPTDDRNLYTCPKQPRHMSASIDKFNYRLLYADLFGGVSAMSVEQFVKANGFSNKYWGWGGEDDDMAIRLRQEQYHIARYPMSIARYTMLTHKQQVANPKRYQILGATVKQFKNDGLNTLHYELKSVTQHHLYTSVLANIDEHS